MILSDGSIREAIEAGRIVIDPLGENAIQPSSVDVRVGRTFRVFANHRHPYIDVRADQELTELVEVTDDEPFILHPGEFVLGTTHEHVTIPHDLVARLEGKSSLARLGLLIHSSLPGDELVPLLIDGEVRQLPIGDIVRKQLQGSVVSFDPDTFEVSYHPVTGWYEGPADRIYEVVLASGRRVRVTAGHNLFTLDRDGELQKVRTGALAPGALVAIPRRIPDPDVPAPVLDLIALAPEQEHARLIVTGPTVARAIADGWPELRTLLEDAGITAGWYWRRNARLPLEVAKLVPGLLEQLGPDDQVRVKGGRSGLPCHLAVDTELAWLLGLYTAEGYRRDTQVVLSNTDEAILDRVESVLRRLALPVYRAPGASITCCSSTLSSLLRWIGMDGKALAKRVPSVLLGWPRDLLIAFYDGFVDGDGSREPTRDSLWTSSDRLVDDLLLLAARMGRRAGVTTKRRGASRLHQVYLPHAEHKLLTSVPLPDRLLVAARESAGLDLLGATQRAGFKSRSSICNLEQRTQRDAVRRTSLARLLEVYARSTDDEPVRRLDRLVRGDLAWDRVVEVRDTGRQEPIYDLEVRPGGRKVENFLAGAGGIFVSNTAGFVDAGWSGELTLELSNVANLPITLYPGMKIGQLAFFQLDRPAEHPYGSSEVGSKYQGQQGPTASRYFENFPGASAGQD